MIQPGKDSNFQPNNSGTMMNYLPHGMIGIVIVLVLVMIFIHLSKRGRRR